MTDASKVAVESISADDADFITMIEEGHFADVKSRDIAPAKLTKTLSAFANTAGGDIYVGIAERTNGDLKERSWVGFDDQEAANAIFQVAEALDPVGSAWAATFLRCDERPGYVLHLSINKTRKIILDSKGTAYVRRGANSLPVQGAEALKALEYDKGINSFEDDTVNAPIDHITNSTTVIEFLLEQVPSGEPDRWLRSQLVIVNDKPTVAGALLFSDEPQALLPKRSAVKLFRYKTSDEDGERDQLAFDPITVEGPIYDLIKETVASTKQMVEGVKKIGGGGVEDISYPDETLHEIVTNAILHRDYSIATDIQIRVYDDRVEVQSPGRLPGHVTIENVLDEQFARNPKLVRLINRFPDPPNKDVGEGLNTAFQAMRKIRLRDPEVVENDNSVTVFIRHTRLSSPAQIVMEYLETHETITNQIGREMTGIRRDVQMKDIFVALRGQGAIELVPGKRGKASAWRKKTNTDAGVAAADNEQPNLL